MHDSALVLGFMADPPRNGPNRGMPPKRPRQPQRMTPLGRRRNSFWSRVRNVLERWTCWAFAVLGKAALKATIWLALNGFLSRAQVHYLLRWSSALHRISIRLLRRGHW